MHVVGSLDQNINGWFRWSCSQSQPSTLTSESCQGTHLHDLGRVYPSMCKCVMCGDPHVSLFFAVESFHFKWLTSVPNTRGFETLFPALARGVGTRFFALLRTRTWRWNTFSCPPSHAHVAARGRYKVRAVGDPIRVDDEVVLESVASRGK
jgi:hypothetical protein